MVLVISVLIVAIKVQLFKVDAFNSLYDNSITQMPIGFEPFKDHAKFKRFGQIGMKKKLIVIKIVLLIEGDKD